MPMSPKPVARSLFLSRRDDGETEHARHQSRVRIHEQAY